MPFDSLALSRLALLFLPFLLILLANPSPAPNPYPAVVSLPSRQDNRVTASQLPPPDIEHDLLPFVLVSTIDGALHAVDRDGGRIRWTLRDGVEPLVGGGVRGRSDMEEYIVEPLSGGLYVFEDGRDGEAAGAEPPKVRKLPLSVEQLIELSPFTFPHTPSRIFTGSKHTSLLTIDLRTGQQLDCFASLASNLSHPGICDNDQVLDDLEGRGRSTRDTLFVGRTDYRLTIHSPPTGDAVRSSADIAGNDNRKQSGLQEIVYSTYTPNSFDRPLAEFWTKVGSSAPIVDEDGSESKRTRVELAYDGEAVGVEEGGDVRWITPLGSVGIAVYDLLLPLSPASAQPILVPQPPPHLPSLFPLPATHHSGYPDFLNKPASTYIGTVPFQLTLPPASTTGKSPSQPKSASRLSDTSRARPLLYALSSASYPLINLAPGPRPGSFANGSFLLSEDVPERNQLLPYLLDPPPEDKVPAIPGDSSLTDVKPLEIPTSGSRRWAWWFFSLLGGMALFVATITIRGRKLALPVVTPVSHSIQEPPIFLDSRVAERKTVTIIEPEIPKVTSSSAIGPSFPVELDCTPAKKKSGRRRVRGKKKRSLADDAVSKAGDEDDDGEDEDERGESSSSPPKMRLGKPLPDLPREMSSTNLLDMDDKERLCISDTVIGFGSHGTVVLKGTWGGRPVAVKRLLSDFTRLASQEVKLLQASDDHPNVIRYYCQERRDNFLYIALDLCQASLADLIESPDKHMELASALDRKKALMQITAGVKHLHGMKIIHRDIKPQNVLILQCKDGSLRTLVSDFGLARRLEQDQSSFAPTANNLAGSLGWRAPECIRGQVRLNDGFDPTSSSSSSSSGDLLDVSERDHLRSYGRLTKAVDLFALGCLYFWVLMSGEHPFGQVYDRESNIVKGDVVGMSNLDVLGEDGYEAKDLIARLLAMDPAARPDTSECMIHPLFWTPAKRLAFLCDASDRFEIMELDPPEPTLIMLETDAAAVIGKDWYTRLDKVFTSNLGKYRKYKGGSVRDLLRAMRNKKHHYQDLEPAVKRVLGSLPTGFLNYFTSRYPALFLHVHAVVKNSRLRHESMFEGYFQDGGG